MVTVQRSRNRGLPPPRPAWLKELENGRKLYIRLGASPLKLKSALTSYNVFEKAVAYWRSAMNADTDVDFPHVLLGMMKTGMYYPSAAWTFGKKMDLIHASTLFDLCRNSDTAIMEDVLRNGVLPGLHRHLQQHLRRHFCGAHDPRAAGGV